MIGLVEEQQIAEQYDAADLVYALGLDVYEIMYAFADEVEHELPRLLDKERGIGL